MKKSLSASLVLHAAALGFGMLALSAPKPYQVADVESLPVDMVSISEYTQIVRGDRKAPPAETPAPTPTSRPDKVEDAVHVGDNSVDLDKPPTPAPRPRPAESAAASRAEPEPAPPSPAPEPERQAAAEPAPAQPPAPAPEAETQAAEKPQETEPLKLPERAPVPQARPSRQPVQTARAEERKRPERPVEEASLRRDEDAPELDLDEVAALIDRAKASGGGARRSEQTAALGNRRDSPAAELSQSELDALRSQLEGCWNPPIGTVGSSEFTASVQFNVDASRRLSGPPTIIRSSGNRQFDDSVLRAVHICNDRGFQLPEGKQSVWANIVVNFDPSGMY